VSWFDMHQPSADGGGHAESEMSPRNAAAQKEPESARPASMSVALLTVHGGR